MALFCFVWFGFVLFSFLFWYYYILWNLNTVSKFVCACGFYIHTLQLHIHTYICMYAECKRDKQKRERMNLKGSQRELLYKFTCTIISSSLYIIYLSGLLLCTRVFIFIFVFAIHMYSYSFPFAYYINIYIYVSVSSYVSLLIYWYGQRIHFVHIMDRKHNFVSSHSVFISFQKKYQSDFNSYVYIHTYLLMRDLLKNWSILKKIVWYFLLFRLFNIRLSCPQLCFLFFLTVSSF